MHKGNHVKVATNLGSPVERATRLFFTRMMTAVARTQQDEALSIAQIATAFLVDEAGSLRVSELSDKLGLSLSATSRMVDGLVERGLLRREEDPEDRRARVLTLTAKGQAFVDRLSEERMAVIRDVAQSLPESLAGGVIAGVSRIGAAIAPKRKK
jgi:DNA-binding MarR family transcriptional regulator